MNKAVSIWRFSGRTWPSLCAAALSFILSFSGEAADPGAATRAFNSGKTALDDGVYTVAEKQFRFCLQKFDKNSPESAEASILLARALIGQNRSDEAVRLLTGADAASAYWRASAYFTLGKYDRGVKELSGFVEKYGENEYTAGALRLLARCHLQLKEVEAALDLFGRIQEKYGATNCGPANLLDWAQALSSLDRGEEARGILTNLFAGFPDSDEGQRGRQLMGWILMKDKRFDEAAIVVSAFVTQAQARVEYRTEAAFLLAEIQEARNLMEAATNALRYAADIAPGPETKRKALTTLGMTLLRMKLPESGLACLKPYITAIPQDPDAAVFQLALADAFLDANSNQQAAAEYRYYIDTFSDREGKARALAGLGWSLWMMDVPRYDEAAAAYLQAADLSVNAEEKARCLVKAADCRFRAGKYDLAQETYRKAIEQFPSSPLAGQAWFQIAESLARAGKTKEAEAEFRRFAATNSANLSGDQALLRLAEIHEDRGEMSDALKTYEMIMSNTNSTLFADALLGHGIVNYGALRFESALVDFDRLIANAPRSELAEHAWYMRARCFQITGRRKQAYESCREFIDRFPASKLTAKVVFWLGECLYNDGNYRDAEAQFEKISLGFTNDSLFCSALLRAGESAVKQKEYLRAIEYFARLARERPGSALRPKARYAHGDAKVELGDFSSAILIFEEIINKYPENYLADRARIRKGDCEFALGRDDKERYKAAMDMYRAVAESQTTAPDIKLQAQYKIGNCLRKLEKDDQAFEQYYTGVVMVYIEDQTGAMRNDPSCDFWFTRAVFDAADILGGQKKYGQELKLLKRVIEAGGRASEEARQRIDKIRRKYWDFLLLE